MLSLGAGSAVWYLLLPKALLNTLQHLGHQKQTYTNACT